MSVNYQRAFCGQDDDNGPFRVTILGRIEMFIYVIGVNYYPNSVSNESLCVKALWMDGV